MDEFHERRLAAAIRAEDSDMPALLDAQADLVQHRHHAAADRGTVEFDQRGGTVRGFLRNLDIH